MHGRFLAITVPPTSQRVSFNLLSFYRKELQLLGVNSLLLSGQESALILDQLAQGFESGFLVPPEVEAFALEQVLAAYQAVQKGAKNKIVLAL